MKTCGLAFLIFSVVLSTCTKACAKDLVHRTGKKKWADSAGTLQPNDEHN
nr:hypothetical protein [Acinetobacter nosocomialis]